MPRTNIRDGTDGNKRPSTQSRARTKGKTTADTLERVAESN